MKRTVSAMEARKHFGELLEQVRYRGDQVVIERAGRPMAVLVPVGEAREMERHRSEAKRELVEMLPAFREQFSHLQDLSEDELHEQVDVWIKEVRTEWRDG